MEERRLFTYEERKNILKRSYNICACCGQKLTTKTMTVEHVIPLSRGGTNDPKNLIALCYDCNQLKDNMLYIPTGFYSALINKSLIIELEQYVHNWFETISDEFELEAYPLIAPKYNMIINPIERPHAKIPFAKQFLLQWSLIGKDYYEEIEAVTGIDIKSVREKTNHIYGTHKHLVPLYALRKVSTDKILAVVSVLLDTKNNYLTIYMPWCCMTKHQIPSILYMMIINLMGSVTKVAKTPIDAYTVATEYEHSLDLFRYTTLPQNMGFAYRDLSLQDTLDGIEVLRKRPDFVKFN